MRMTSYRLSPLEEAENCRRQALAYLGRPEASFLLRVAEAFEGLNDEIGSVPSRAGSTDSVPSPVGFPRFKLTLPAGG